jgi:hypothetical protein
MVEDVGLDFSLSVHLTLRIGVGGIEEGKLTRIKA